jgi:hypothetical protein
VASSGQPVVFIAPSAPLSMEIGESAQPVMSLALAGPGGAGVASVRAGDASVVVGGTAQSPTVQVSTLDVMAVLHPPAADWSNNGHKITGLAPGVAGADAVIMSQVPSAGMNSGAAAPVNIGTGAGEIVIASVTIPGGLAAGATFRLTAWGTVSIGGTAGNLTGHARIGGLGGPQLGNLTSGQFTLNTNGFWRFSGLVTLQSPGASATWAGEFEQSALVGSSTSNGPGVASATRDSTVAQVFVLTLTLGSATSTAVCTSSLAERVA